MASRYWRWCIRFDRDYPSVARLLSAFPFLSISKRKVILAFCRVQPRLIEGSRFVERYRRELFETTFLPPAASETAHPSYDQLWVLLCDIQWTANSPLICGLISIAVRSAPYLDYSSVELAISDGIQKELVASTSDPLPDLDFTPILGETEACLFVRMRPNLPLRPEVHRLLRACLRESRNYLRGMILYPKTSKKSLGRDAIQTGLLETEGMELWRGRGVYTLEDVEGVYHETGVKVRGVVELRFAWKYNDLRPRIYFAQGSTVYHDSKYIQAVFNVICDTIPICHRKNRFQTPLDSEMGRLIRMFIYDYSTFTSRLTQIYAFCDSLANFYDGVMVWIVDTFEGPKQIDLGELLRRFNRTCNDLGEFDVSRVFSLEEKESFFHCAGMLGVPGNITPCTMIHAIHIAIVVSSLYRCRCVGDDAFALLEMEEKDQYAWLTCLDQLRNLGDIAVEKAEFWDFDSNPQLDTWQYVKRPLKRIETVIGRGLLFDFPSLESLLDLSDKYHKSTIDRSLAGRRRLFMKQWARLLTQIHYQQPDVDEVTARFVYRYFRSAMVHLDLPNDHVRATPYVTIDGESLGWVPAIRSWEDIGKDWVRKTLLEWREGGTTAIARVPELITTHDHLFGVPGETGIVSSSKRYRLMEKLGYARMSLRICTYELDPIQDYELAVVLASGDYSFSYDIEILRDLPDWFHTLDMLESISREDR